MSVPSGRSSPPRTVGGRPGGQTRDALILIRDTAADALDDLGCEAALHDPFQAGLWTGRRNGMREMLRRLMEAAGTDEKPLALNDVRLWLREHHRILEREWRELDGT